MRRLLLLACLLAGGSPAAAQDPTPAPDAIVLGNGDRLTGRVVGVEGGKLTFDVPAVGKITVALAGLRSIETTGTVTVRDLHRVDRQRRIAGLEGQQLVLVDPASGERSTLAFTELSAINPPPVAWTGSVAINGIVQTGNTERRAIGATADASRRTDDDRTTLRASWDYAEEKTAGAWTLTQRRLGGSGKYDRFLDADTYAFVNAAAEYDALANLDLRFLAGGGIGQQWVERDDLKFSTDAGVVWFYENYRTAAPSEDYVALQFSYDLEWLVVESLKFLQTFAVFPSLEDKDDVYFKMDSRLRWTMAGDMFSQLQWVWDYDNTPPPGAERNDHRVMLGVGWDF
jgi:hypothetical protein